MQTYDDLPKLARDYLLYLLTIKGRSQRTVDGYAIDLRTFFRFMKLHRGQVPADCVFEEILINDIDDNFIRSVSLSDVYEFLNYTMRSRSNGAKTRARKVSSLRGFFKYLTVNTQLLTDNPVKNLEIPAAKKSLPIHLSVEQSVKLLDEIGARSSGTQYRDYCILTLFLNCGMRLSELVGINLSSFDRDSGALKLLGKGNKERLVYLNEACQDAIDNYLTKERGQLKTIVDKDALFLSCRSGKRLGARQVQLVVSGALKAAGLDHMGFSTHKLRHTAATLLYQEGNVDLLVLKEMLGHANVGTTEIYTHVSNKKVQEAAAKNPLAHKKKR
jgi:integrase/recombinase XerC